MVNYIHYLCTMKFRVFSQLSYEVFSKTTFFFNIQALRSANQIIHSESLSVSAGLKLEEFSLKNSEVRFVKMVAEQGVAFTITYEAEVDVQYRVVDAASLLQASSIIDIDTEVLPFIAPSRHCPSDILYNWANKEFGYLSNEYSKVLAINDWIFRNITYKTGVSNSSTSASDTLLQREGVCKDFAHLAIALCRAIDIPARYFTGYAWNINPPDFHACFEAYIGGQWVLFDPTKLGTLNAMVKIATGKDATEIPVASFYGNTNCTYMDIRCEVLGEGFRPFQQSDDIVALAYE